MQGLQKKLWTWSVWFLRLFYSSFPHHLQNNLSKFILKIRKKTRHAYKPTRSKVFSKIGDKVVKKEVLVKAPTKPATACVVHLLVGEVTGSI